MKNYISENVKKIVEKIREELKSFLILLYKYTFTSNCITQRIESSEIHPLTYLR